MYRQLCLALGMLLPQVLGQRNFGPVSCSAEGVVFDANGDCCDPSNVRRQLRKGLVNKEYDLFCAENLSIPGLEEATSEDIDRLDECVVFSFDELSSACTIISKPETSSSTD
ncbi:hypothetical protein MY4824_003829 [Beauveria thailandica]